MRPAEALAQGTCPVTRKFAFDSRKAARRFIRSRRGFANFAARWEYHCSHCGLWHITSHAPRPHPTQPAGSA